MENKSGWRLSTTKPCAEFGDYRKDYYHVISPENYIKSELTNAINFVLIFSMESSKYLNSWLVSSTRISITDFDDFFTGEETLTGSLFKSLFIVELLDKFFWTESWSSVRAVNKWLWVCLTLMEFHVHHQSHHQQQKHTLQSYECNIPSCC